jgi:transcriptional regulator with XRE-family HTH domain
MEHSRIPNRLRYHRLRHGLLQKELAILLQLHDSSMLIRWEKGICFPNFLNLCALCAVFTTEIGELYPDIVREVHQAIDGHHKNLTNKKSVKLTKIKTMT